MSTVIYIALSVWFAHAGLAEELTSNFTIIVDRASARLDVEETGLSVSTFMALVQPP